MKDVELYAKVRHAVRIEGLSERAAARRFGIDARTVNKMMKFSVPPGYRRSKPPVKPKLGSFIAIIDAILVEDKDRPKKQQHTSKRIFERLRDEHGYSGGITIVKDYVALCRQRSQEMFVPLEHPAGHAQVDFDEAIGIIGGEERKIHFFAMDLPHSLAELELIDRERRMVERRVKAAKFPTVKTLDSFDFAALPSLNKALVIELARSEYVERRENIIAVGNSGTGKSHIALGLGLAACQKGFSVGFTTAGALVHELIEARDEKRLLRLQRQLAGHKLLIVDELGYVPLSQTGAELLFEVFSQRYERGATIVTSNLPFDEWTGVFGSERLTGALLDRLTHHVLILEMNGESYRLVQSKRRSRRSQPDTSFSETPAN
jgi:DNA replication protein DnaC